MNGAPASQRQGEDAPYTGERIEFRQLADASKRVVDLDHVVSLANAFVCGAYRWRADGPKWGSFANDPGNIMACGTAVNQSKGARNAAGWLPPNPVHDFRCRLVVLQIQVKARYKLAVTESEAAAMRRVLAERQP